jgi:hypothetical protein
MRGFREFKSETDKKGGMEMNKEKDLHFLMNPGYSDL